MQNLPGADIDYRPLYLAHIVCSKLEADGLASGHITFIAHWALPFGVLCYNDSRFEEVLAVDPRDCSFPLEEIK